MADVDASLGEYTEEWWSTPTDAMDELVGVPDALEVEFALPDGDTTRRSLNLDHLVRWYAMGAQGRSGNLPFANGYGEVRHDADAETIRCDLTVRSLGGDEDSMVRPGPTLVGRRDATLDLLQPLLQEVLHTLATHDVDIDRLTREVVVDADGTPYDEAVWESLLE